jgi:MFS-type transporter involved in bile tolerance (Atg22 family)
MPRAISPPTRLLAATLIDWTGTGFYLAIAVIFLTRSAGLTPGQVGYALSGVGVVAFAGSVHVGRLGDRFGPREVLCSLHVLRALAFVALVAVPLLAVTLAMLAVIGLADQAAASLNQALAGELVGEGERVPFMARLRTVMNIGIALGTLPAGIVLAGAGSAFGPLLAANAGSYLLAAAIVATLPRRSPAPVAPARRRLLIPSAPTAALITVDGLMSMWNVVLNVGLPLWILRSTAAPPALVAVLYAVNTVLAVALQSRVSRKVDTYLRAAQAQRLAGLCLAACCACMAVSAFGGRAASTSALCVAVVCLTLGELLKASAAWQITFTLAPAARSAEFFATYGLGRIAAQVCGPLLITVGVLALGSAGWLLLAVLFVAGGAVTPGLARRARTRPVVGRTPRIDPPTYAVCAVPA